MIAKRRYPIGIQTFEKLVEEGFLYIDKTEYIYRMTHENYQYVFLSRPRRFGKSLLTSTLRSYFEGRKDLFQGLAIEQLETEWEAYPVLHFDMSTCRCTDAESLQSMLNAQLRGYEKVYGRNEEDKIFSDRLKSLIIRVFEQTGKRVVVLIDEYDTPLLHVLHDDEALVRLREVMQNFYSPLKVCDPYLRFCFLTGITKFSQLSIFSVLNNIKNISMMPEYAAVCGISREELETQMLPDIESLAERMELTRDKALAELKNYYDGYHFTLPSPDIYNPYSLMNAFSDGDIKPYWFETGTPTYLIEMMRKFNVTPSQVGREDSVLASGFDAPTERMTNLTPLMYQSGYMTIKDYDRELRSYSLDIPNKEIRIGLMESLLPYYVRNTPRDGTSAVIKMYKALRRDDMDGCLRELQDFLGCIPYTDNTNYEGHYQQVFFIIFTLMGMYVDVEVHTPRGRVDIVMYTRTRLYIIELKMNRDAATAMAQINLRDYPARFYDCPLPRVKVGVNFDGATRNICDWKIESSE